jgi:hypothetical protein
MRSEKQISASRANGALSRGPKTAEGKARSSRNATRHGLLAKVVVLEEEPDDAFQDLCQAYANRFGPLDEVETGMVEEMVVTFWRMRRAWAIENRYFDTAMASQQGPSATDRLMDAFSGLSDNNRLNLLHRYETRLHMMYQRAFRNLITLRKLGVSGAGLPAGVLTPKPAAAPTGAPTPLPPPIRDRPEASAPVPPAILLPVPPSESNEENSRPIPNEPKNPIPINKSHPPEPQPNPTQPNEPKLLDTTPKGS